MAETHKGIPVSENNSRQILDFFKKDKIANLKMNIAVVRSRYPGMVEGVEMLHELRAKHGVEFGSVDDLILHLSVAGEDIYRGDVEYLTGLRDTFLTGPDKKETGLLFRAADNMVGQIRNLSKKK